MNIYISMALLYLLFINTFENALIFSLVFLITMLLSDFIISLLKKYIKVKLLLSLLVTGLITTVVEVLIKRFIPAFYADMNLYLPLMMLIIYDFKSERTVKESFKFTFKKSLRYIILLLVVVLIKEVLSNNTITIMDNVSLLTGYKEIIKLPANNILPIPYFGSFGPFLIVGITLGIINNMRRDNNA